MIFLRSILLVLLVFPMSGAGKGGPGKTPAAASAGAPGAAAVPAAATTPVSPTNTPGTAAPAAALAQSAGRGPACLVDFANPAGTNGYLSADGKLLYLLAAKPVATAAPGAKEAGSVAPQPKINGITLYRVDLTTNKSAAVLSVKQHPASILVNHGDPIQGLSALAFAQVPGACSEGKASGVNLGFDKKEGSASVLGKGSYGVVRSNRGTLMVDLDRRAILETDVQSYQTRVAAKFAEGEVPVFYDLGDHHMVTWNTKARGISLFKSGVKTPEQRIQFKPGDRVLQDRDRFAVMSSDRVANTLTVRLLPKWSKVDKDVEYTVKLPGAYNTADAYVEINLAKSLIAVSAIPGTSRMRWQKVYLFNLKTGQLLATVSGAASQYFEYFAIDPEGKFLLAEVKDLNDRTSVEVRKFDLKKKKESTITLAAPQI